MKPTFHDKKFQGYIRRVRKAQKLGLESEVLDLGVKALSYIYRQHRKRTDTYKGRTIRRAAIVTKAAIEG